MIFTRSIIFSLSMIIMSIAVTLGVLLVFPASFRIRYAVLAHFAKVNMWVLKHICKLDYVVEGRENIPEGPAIIFSKHQSTWETMALQRIFPPLIFVVKRELLWVPFFGWSLKCMAPIAIDRKAGRNAIKQIVDQGIARLKQGLWVVIFPEGTRVRPGTKGRYKIGGAVLAAESGYPVVPVAHDAGHYWPKGRFLKPAGTIRMVIGPPIETTGKSAEQILAEAEAYIEGEMARLDRA